MRRQATTASEYMPYGLTFQHKHVPEMTRYLDARARAAVRAGRG